MLMIIQTYGIMLLKAMGHTLLLCLLSLLFATVIGMIFGLMNVGHNRVLNFIGTVYVDAVRGVPLIVLAYFIYFGIPSGIQSLGFTNFRMNALQGGTIALSMNCGAYMAEIIRAGIQSVDRGQMEAGRSLGLSYGAGMALIVIPQAVRTMIPSIINQFIITLKDTSILSIIGILELTQTGKIIIARNLEGFKVWTIIALIYLIIITLLTWLSNYVQKKMK